VREPRLLIAIKHITKQLIRRFLLHYKIKILFSSEQGVQHLREYLNEFYILQSKGVLHVGAHAGEEAEYYNSLDKKVTWVEGDPDTFIQLIENIKKFPKQNAICALLSDKNDTKSFFITSNKGFSSSLHPILPGVSDWNVNVIAEKVLFTSKFDDLEITDLDDYDFWIIDVQGHEFEVIEGALNSLRHAKWVLIEISTKQFYDSQKVFWEVDELLNRQGFFRLHDPLSEHSDVLYMRRPSIPRP